MDNKKKYHESFINSFDIKNINENLKYNEIPEWDSIGHMRLIFSLEETFSISMETDDIVDFDSYKKGLQILKKYNISI